MSEPGTPEELSERTLLDDILYRRKHPAHYGILAGATATHIENHSCGDILDLYLAVEDNIITDAKFTGSMCSIASYGAELLLEQVIGLSLDQARHVTSADLLPADCTLLTNPVRLKCFTLAQKALVGEVKQSGGCRGSENK